MTEIPELKYDDNGLIPAVVQQHDTGEVLMVAWMNAESLRKTLDTKLTWFWSRSRQELWHKGETSGAFLNVDSIDEDCDGDAILLRVRPAGPACRSCFYANALFPFGLSWRDHAVATSRVHRILYVRGVTPGDDRGSS